MDRVKVALQARLQLRLGGREPISGVRRTRKRASCRVIRGREGERIEGGLEQGWLTLFTALL